MNSRAYYKNKIEKLKRLYPERYEWLEKMDYEYYDIPHKSYALDTEYELMSRESESNNSVDKYSYVFTLYDGTEIPSRIESNVYVKHLESVEMIWFARFTNDTFIFNEPISKEVPTQYIDLGIYSTEWYFKLIESGEYEVLEGFEYSAPIISTHKGAIGYIDKITDLPVYYDQYIKE